MVTDRQVRDYSRAMPSHSRCLIAGALLAGLLVPAVAHTAPGDLDRSFGTDGLVVDREILRGLGEDGTGLRSLTILRGGRPLVQVSQRCGMGCDALDIVRLTAGGATDPAASVTPGRPTLPWPSGSEIWVTGAAVGPDGSLRVGYGSPGARILSVAPDGGIDADTPVADAIIPDVLMGDGGVVGRLVSRPGGLVRLRADGRPHPAFGRGGRRAIPAAMKNVAGVAGGNALRVGGVGRRGPALWTVAPSGSSAGRFTQVPAGVGPDVNLMPGPIATNAAGRAVQVAVAPRWISVVAAFRPDGRVDTAFGDRGGLRVAGTVVGAAVQANGKLVIATRPGAADLFNPGPLTVRRLNADASPDPSFRPALVWAGETGTVGQGALAIDARGRIVLASEGMRAEGYGTGALLLARLRGGEATALRLTSPRRPRTDTVRLTATSSVAGAARVTVRQSGRVVGATTVRFTRGSQRSVLVRLRGASSRPVAVAATLRGTRATGATRVPAVR